MLFRKLKTPLSPVCVVTKDETPYYFKSSVVEGIGVFAKQDLRPDHHLGVFLHCSTCDGLSKIVRDELCRFMNHSDRENVKLVVQPDKNVHAYALEDVSKDSEMFIDYQQTMKMLMKNHFPFTIDDPVRMRTHQLRNFGRKNSKVTLLDELRDIRNGKWQ